MRIAKSWFCTLLIYLAFFGFVVAQPAENIPQYLRKTLDSLKTKDNLSEWIYTRIDYCYHNPSQSLPFLMRTERDSWRKPQYTPEKEAWLMLLSNLGYNQMYSGNILQSISYYELAYNYYINHKLNVEGIAEYVLKPWANNCTRLGDYEKALFIQQKTLDYANKERNDSLAVAVYNNMAISYRSLGDFKNAEDCILLGKKKAGYTAVELILLDNTLADIYNDKEELELAEKVIGKNIARQESRKQDFETAYWLMSSYITAGNIQFRKNNFSLAWKYYKLALSINDQYYKGNRLREKAYTYTQMGKIKLEQKQAAEAIHYFNQTLSSFGLIDNSLQIPLKKIFGDNRLVDVFYQKSLALNLLGKEKEALENIRLALLAADKIRFELADVKTKQRFQAETKQMAEKAIAIAFDLLQKTKQHSYAVAIVDIIEQAKARTLLDDIRRSQQQLTLSTNDTLFQQKAKLEQAIAYNERELLQSKGDIKEAEQRYAVLKFKLEALEKDLIKRYPSMIINKDSPGFGRTAEPLSQLPAHAHFIAFFLGTQNLYVVEIYGNRVKHIKQVRAAPAIKKTIFNFVSTYYHSGPSAMMNQPEAFFLASNQIYRALLGDLKFNKNDKLIIIPDEIIGYLSFDGLITDINYEPSIANWPYLIRSQSLSYAFSIQTWINQAAKKTIQIPNFSGLFITHQNKNKQFIPAVAKEAEAIEKIIGGSFMKDKEAGVKDFFNAFDKANVLHISTHAYLSGLQKEPTLSFNDNEVFLFELSARKTAPDLIVLSACRTADGIMNASEGIISLSRGFAAIGTGGTIAGLWNVNDKAASEITATCYSNMLQGQEISTALHHAKLSWLQNKERQAQEYLPYYWDPLIYMGYDKKVTLKPAQSMLQTYGLPATLLLAAASGIYHLLKIIKKTKRLV
ncbi:tetratricopeptide (TPR) repeat protein [Pedobacter sp. AK017]|uniref:CHAT domain-containing protein n=1 Tax=Pedobacter sp. AK017 TaxID=2723073 RepID=UPI00161BBE70|nr:CHAT domain-containing tetratricopeptide repeat protein [Pedobacter sp. AK017]MBB5440535.1 tetratricopeptide (TPR) repeat protein [Pedobacter sp. AK017]